MNNKVNWGIISTGAIATAFARALAASKTGRLVAVASREQAKAEAFAKQWHADRAHGSYEALLRDPAVRAVYIATPHPFHAEWAIKAARAGKHMLVEKPLAVNHADGMAMIEAAIENDVLLMEAFMYRCHPQTARLVQLLREKAAGEARVIQATFSFQGNFNSNSRIFANALAGGGILDVGCYTVSIARLLAGAAVGKDFSDPVEVTGAAQLGETGVDEWAVAALKFPGGILAQLATGVRVGQENVVRIFGTEARITVPNPFTADRATAERGRILLQPSGESQPQEIIVPTDATAFVYEADVAGDAILAGRKQAASPAMSWDDSLGNLRTLDRWRDAVGLVYDAEKPEGFRRTTVAGDTLRQRDKHNMKYGRIAGVDKPISRLIMGCDNQRTLPHAAVMFDDFFERGGNAFDTAWIYGRGLQEELLGQWMKLRGVRDQIVVTVKGAHAPLCTPRDISWQLRQSLERLGTDHAEIYIMHRDNLEVPAGEFVDVLNEHSAAGRIKVFGGSNWTLARIDEANAYAARHGKQPFSLVSNNFSLARMVQDPWGGCESSCDADSRQWFTKMQMPLLAWSSQARGFFVEGRAAPGKMDDKLLARCWYSEDNFQRQQRVRELAHKKHTEPHHIALAYVLNQPFPTFALFGPRTLADTRTSLPALELQLSPQELRWLNLEE